MHIPYHMLRFGLPLEGAEDYKHAPSSKEDVLASIHRVEQVMWYKGIVVPKVSRFEPERRTSNSKGFHIKPPIKGIGVRDLNTIPIGTFMQFVLNPHFCKSPAKLIRFI